jgi:hypothetical protein
MQNIINKILESNWGIRYLHMVSSLNETQIWILIIVTFLLIALLIYRWMGAGVFWVFLFVVMISYLIYKANLFDFYEKQNEEFDDRMKAIQVEIDSSKPGADGAIPLNEKNRKINIKE